MFEQMQLHWAWFPGPSLLGLRVGQDAPHLRLAVCSACSDVWVTLSSASAQSGLVSEKQLPVQSLC